MLSQCLFMEQANKQLWTVVYPVVSQNELPSQFFLKKKKLALTKWSSIVLNKNEEGKNGSYVAFKIRMNEMKRTCEVAKFCGKIFFV